MTLQRWSSELLWKVQRIRLNFLSALEMKSNARGLNQPTQEPPEGVYLVIRNWFVVSPRLALTVEHSPWTSASGPRNHDKESKASSSKFFPSSQRGESGNGIIKMRSSAGGTAPIKASHLQWNRIPITKANKAPNVKAGPLTEPNTPRTRAAAISAMYT